MIARRIAILFIAVFISISAWAQISIGDFIGSAVNDPEVKTFDQQVVYLKGKPYRLSPLQKMEFRYQNREISPDMQRFGLRFNPANPWEVRNNNRYFQEYQSSLSLEKEMALKEALTERYYLIIDYLYYAGLKSLATESHKLISDQVSILEKQTASSFFDADEYVELKVEQTDKAVALEEIEFELLDLQQKIERVDAQAFQKTIDWKWDGVMSVDRIRSVVDSLMLEAVRSSYLAYQQQKIKLAKSEYDLEKSNISIGYLQTQFDKEDADENRTPINIALGVTIPIVNPNKGDMTKKKLDAIEAEFDLEEAQVETQADQTVGKMKLDQLIERHRALEVKVADFQKSDLGRTLSTLKGGDPLILVRFDQSLVKVKVLLLKMKRNILLSYIDYLASTDRLQQEPLINFFSPSLEQLSHP